MKIFLPPVLVLPLLLAFFISNCFALTPEEIVLLANRRNPAGLELARYYMQKRKIPRENLLILDVPDTESCDRRVYEENIAAPTRSFLEGGKRIRCLVTVYGLPLKITGPMLATGKTSLYEELKKRKDELSAHFEKTKESGRAGKNIKQQLQNLKNKLNSFIKDNDQRASVDSELALVRRYYPLSGWLANPWFMGPALDMSIGRDDVLWVSRLDGPDPQVVKRIIDEAIAAEEQGLKGTAYFDARWPLDGEPKSAYGLYDRYIHKAAGLMREKGLDVVLDSEQSLFKPGECPRAALYCGWYSLANYVDAFAWQPGSVGYHIASAECVTLKKKESRVWVKMMLEKGICATIGPVGEPYLRSFPLPQLFFALLSQGQNLVESYFLSLPVLSWKMVLVGDPLYRPFKGR